MTCLYCDGPIPPDSKRKKFCCDKHSLRYHRNLARGDDPKAPPRKPGRQAGSKQLGLRRPKGTVTMPDEEVSCGGHGDDIQAAHRGDPVAVARLGAVGVRVWKPVVQ